MNINWYAIVVLMGWVSFVAADDPIEKAKKFPPTVVNLDPEIAAIEWQIEQLQPMIAEYESRHDEINAMIFDLQSKISQLNNEVPPALRNIDKQVRSQLIGKAMEKLLDAKLELAAIEQSVLQLERRNSEKDDRFESLKRQETQLETAKALKRYELSEAEYQQLKELRKAGTVSQQQAQRAQASYEIAKLEYANAQTRHQIEAERAKADVANRLTQKRLAAAPVRAKIVTIEEFLERISGSTSTLTEIEQHRRVIDMRQHELQMVAGELFELKRSKTELSILKRLIDAKIQQTGAKK